MKIHIVQKGDTLWEIAKQYGVDFEQLKQANSQLASPDMIMPGMKIKIPSSSKHVKKEGMKKEEVKKEFKKEKKEIEIKQAPKPKVKEVEKEKLMKPKIPTFEKPVYPVYPLPEIEQDVKGVTEKKPYVQKEEVKPQQMKKEKPHYEYPSIPQDQHFHHPIMPCCCHVMPPCYCSKPHYPMQMPMMGCGCGHYPVQMQHPFTTYDYNYDPQMMDMTMQQLNQTEQYNDGYSTHYDQYNDQYNQYNNYPTVPNVQHPYTALNNSYRPTPPKFPSFPEENSEKNNDG